MSGFASTYHADDPDRVDDGFRRFCTACNSWSKTVYRCDTAGCERELTDNDQTIRVAVSETSS